MFYCNKTIRNKAFKPDILNQTLICNKTMINRLFNAHNCAKQSKQMLIGPKYIHYFNKIRPK